MSEHHLGPLPFDIHGGGLDLIFPHHENEIAQSCSAHGIDTMAQFWLHNGFVDMRGEKMSKSIGNVLRMDEALAMAPGEAIRLFLLTAHYRQPLDFTTEGLAQAKQALDQFYGALFRAGVEVESDPRREIVEALCDDLNTPQALARLHVLLSELNGASWQQAAGIAGELKASARLMGLLEASPKDWLRGKEENPAHIDALITERTAARRARNFARADAIRNELMDQGVILEDGASGTTWRRA